MRSTPWRWERNSVGHKDANPNIAPAAFPERLGLPELRIASDARLMRDVFQRHLRPLNGNRLHIQDCVITRRRYRQAGGCILQYALSLLDWQTGLERIHWATGIMYRDDRAERTWQKLRAANQSQETVDTSQSFEPNSFIPELRMLVQLFPHDRRMPALSSLIFGAPPELEALLLARFGRGNWRVETLRVDPVRYRAWLAVVLRYTISAVDSATGRRAERRFFLKMYAYERGEQIYQLLQSLSQNNGAAEGFNVARPVAYSSEMNAVIQEEAPGISFQQILLDSRNGEVGWAARRVARALASLHLDHDHVPAAKHVSVADEVERLEDARDLLQWACPHLSEKIGAVVAEIVARLEEVPLKPTHLDLKTDHMLLDGDRCAIIDLDSFAKADPVLDPAHLLAQIVGLTLRFPVPQSRLRAGARLFADEYFKRVPASWRERLVTHYSGAALKTAVGFFRRQEPQWSEKVAAMLTEAKFAIQRRLVTTLQDDTGKAVYEFEETNRVSVLSHNCGKRCTVEVRLYTRKIQSCDGVRS